MKPKLLPSVSVALTLFTSSGQPLRVAPVSRSSAKIWWSAPPPLEVSAATYSVPVAGSMTGVPVMPIGGPMLPEQLSSPALFSGPTSGVRCQTTEPLLASRA